MTRKEQKAPNITLRIPTPLKSWLKVYCATNEISMTEVITELLEKFKSEKS